MTDPSPAPDSHAFRRTIGLFATGVSVVALQTPDGVAGMTANAICSVSLEPLLVLVCVDRKARLARDLGVGRPFSINILREDQEVLSRYFGGGWHDLPPPEFRFEDWDGTPRLVGALASIRCAVDRLHDGGDHWIVLGRVVGLFEASGPSHPLIFYAGRYRRLAPPPVPAAPPERWGPDGVATSGEDRGAPRE
ncbi:MAG: flavin reductase family protein [Armatimonadota bacterium]|nr:flavin reductase family protein [Armatimonadota bacterium]